MPKMYLANLWKPAGVIIALLSLILALYISLKQHKRHKPIIKLKILEQKTFDKWVLCKLTIAHKWREPMKLERIKAPKNIEIAKAKNIGAKYSIGVKLKKNYIPNLSSVGNSLDFDVDFFPLSKNEEISRPASCFFFICFKNCSKIEKLLDRLLLRSLKLSFISLSDCRTNIAIRKKAIKRIN